VFSKTPWSYAVQHEEHNDGSNHLAEISAMWKFLDVNRAG
jgi:hypothetical protein